MAAGRPFHGSFVATPRAPLCSALMARLLWVFGGCGAKALASGLVQSPLMLVIAKAGKFAVWFGCHNGQRCWYSWRAPVVGSSVSNGNRVGGFCVLILFAIRRDGASCSGEVLRTGCQAHQRWCTACNQAYKRTPNTIHLRLLH